MLWEVEELIKLSEIQPEMVEDALKDLWEKKPSLHKSVVINAYLDSKISLAKASDILDVSRVELEKELREKGIPIRHLSREDVNAEVEAIKGW